MTPQFELFEHTADLGVRAWAPSLAELVAPVTAGLYAAIGEVCTAGGPGEAWCCELGGQEPALLLRDYLAEVLLLFDCQRCRIMDPQVEEFTAGRLSVRATALPVDLARSVLLREVKAITYHELAVRPVADGYEAVFIVDI